jgi:hypothetical protein
MELLRELDDGHKREITEKDYDYFLGVLPPVVHGFDWNGERWNFGFSEGAEELICAFKKVGNKYFAQMTNLRNPRDCGVPLEVQLAEAARLAPHSKRTGKPGSWIPTWIKLGKTSPHIRLASDPPFNTRSFHECKDDGELLDKLAQDTWPAGQVLYRDDLCFIQEVDGGDEWLAIKQDKPIRTVLFGWIIKDRGRQAAQNVLDQLRAVRVDRSREVSY